MTARALVTRPGTPRHDTLLDAYMFEGALVRYAGTWHRIADVAPGLLVWEWLLVRAEVGRA